MADRLRVKLGRHLLPIPALLWRTAITRAVRDTAASYRRLSPQHQAVRRFVVEQLGLHGQPVRTTTIADTLALSPARVDAILTELERRKVYLVRDDEGAVAWAFPVTSATTPHHLAFESGERLDAA